MAEYAEFYIDQGTDFEAFITLDNDDTNIPENVSSYIVTCQLRRSLVSANASETLLCELTDAANGEMRISLAASNTANLKAGSYFYDVKVFNASSNSTSRLIEGVMRVMPGITK